ncbi:hypothetical protein MHYP_G00191450 [Metynnis hypsauchen]
MSYSLVTNGSYKDRFHRGSAPNLLPPPRCESLGLRPLRKRLSIDVLRNKAPELGPIKWPSLVTICKWKQNLTERLLKRRHGSYDQKLLAPPGPLPKAHSALAFERGSWKRGAWGEKPCDSEQSVWSRVLSE